MTIRRQPTDFVVQERLGEASRAALRPVWDPDARHAIYELTKTSRTTPEAAQELARALHINPSGVSYAGLKDKHAHTNQHFSARVEQRDVAGSLPAEVAGRQWSARLIGWLPEALEAAAIDGNRFIIIVRGLARETCDEMDRRAGLLACDPPKGGSETEPALLVVNYFGAQRFGSARHGQGFIATHLIRGEFEQALKLAIATPARKDAGRTRIFTRLATSRWGNWDVLARELPRCPERAPIELLAAGKDFREAFASLPYFLQSMYVEAFQSHLWNRTAHALAARIGGSPRECLRSDDEFGEMLFPLARSPALAASTPTWREMILPVLGPGTALEEPWRAAASEAMQREGIEQSSLRIPGLRRPFFGEAPRPLFVRAARFEMPAPQRDDLDPSGKRGMRTVSFELPRGAYATVVLRALGQ